MLFSLYFYLVLFLRLPYILLGHKLKGLLRQKRCSGSIRNIIVVQESLCLALIVYFVVVYLLHLKELKYYYKLTCFVGHIQLNVNLIYLRRIPD